MSIWQILAVICAGGAIGGIVNALLSDNGFLLPQAATVDQLKIIRPGFLGNILISAVAAGVSWGLYGPFTTAVIIGPAPAGTPPLQPNLTMSALVGAVLVGIAGAKWLTNEVDKKLLKAAASTAASAQPRPGVHQQMMLATPAQALTIAKNLRDAA